MTIDKHIHGKRRLNLVLQGNEATTVPCSACGRSFTAECCRDAMIKLIRHLQENMADVKHRAELEWIKNELFSRKVHRRANRLAHSFHKLCVYSDGFCHRVPALNSKYCERRQRSGLVDPRDDGLAGRCESRFMKVRRNAIMATEKQWLNVLVLVASMIIVAAPKFAIVPDFILTHGGSLALGALIGVKGVRGLRATRSDVYLAYIIVSLVLISLLTKHSETSTMVLNLITISVFAVFISTGRVTFYGIKEDSPETTS
jgi:hypothetical protein